MLDILEDYCEMRNFSFVRLDGQTNCEERFNLVSYLFNITLVILMQKNISAIQITFYLWEFLVSMKQPKNCY